MRRNVLVGEYDVVLIDGQHGVSVSEEERFCSGEGGGSDAYERHAAWEKDGGKGEDDGDGHQHLDDVDEDVVLGIAQQNVTCVNAIVSLTAGPSINQLIAWTGQATTFGVFVEGDVAEERDHRVGGVGERDRRVYRVLHPARVLEVC